MTVDCVTLWIGESLGPVERACLRSMLRQGHSVALYCYRPVEGVPDGIEIRDASEVLPETAILHHKDGSVALFSDWFRYELQRRGLGTWVDTDNYLVRPLDMKRPYLFGKEVLHAPRPWGRWPKEIIAAGVLRIPAESPMLPPLIELFESATTPQWLPFHWQLWARFRSSIGRPLNLSSLPWGVAGPFGVNALAEQFGAASWALPPQAFNPAHWYEARWILDPSVSLEEFVTEETFGVHLWNECIKSFKNDPAPAGSFLDRLHREGAE